jgi:hypothetical protein
MCQKGKTTFFAANVHKKRSIEEVLLAKSTWIGRCRGLVFHRLRLTFGYKSSYFLVLLCTKPKEASGLREPRVRPGGGHNTRVCSWLPDSLITLPATRLPRERRLPDFQHYYNEHRTHAGRQGHPPVTGVNAHHSLENLSCYRWQKYCRGLYLIPNADCRLILGIRH